MRAEQRTHQEESAQGSGFSRWASCSRGVGSYSLPLPSSAAEPRPRDLRCGDLGQADFQRLELLEGDLRQRQRGGLASRCSTDRRGGDDRSPLESNPFHCWRYLWSEAHLPRATPPQIPCDEHPQIRGQGSSRDHQTELGECHEPMSVDVTSAFLAQGRSGHNCWEAACANATVVIESSAPVAIRTSGPCPNREPYIPTLAPSVPAAGPITNATLRHPRPQRVSGAICSFSSCAESFGLIAGSIQAKT